MVLLVEDEENLQRMQTNLEEGCIEYGLKINVYKTKSLWLGHEKKRIQIKVKDELIEQVNGFRYLGSWMSEDGRSESEIKRRIANEAFNNKKGMLYGPMKKELRKRLIKCYVWSVLLYGCETWTLRSKDIKRLKAYEMWTWRRLERISWMDKVTNQEVLMRVGEKRRLMHEISKRKRNWIGHILRRGNCLMRNVMERMVNGNKKRGRKRLTLLCDIKEGENTEN